MRQLLQIFLQGVPKTLQIIKMTSYMTSMLAKIVVNNIVSCYKKQLLEIKLKNINFILLVHVVVNKLEFILELVFE